MNEYHVRDFQFRGISTDDGWNFLGSFCVASWSEVDTVYETFFACAGLWKVKCCFQPLTFGTVLCTSVALSGGSWKVKCCSRPLTFAALIGVLSIWIQMS